MNIRLDKIHEHVGTPRVGASMDRSLLLTAALIFIGQQAIEFVMLVILQKSYTSLCLWDCGWYTTIVEHGYDIEPHGHSKGDAASWAFFPALPTIAKIMFHLFGLSSAGSLVLAGKAFFFWRYSGS